MLKRFQKFQRFKKFQKFQRFQRFKKLGTVVQTFDMPLKAYVLIQRLKVSKV